MNNEVYRDIKTFNDWNEEKKKLHISEPEKLTILEGSVWWCSIGKNLGREQDGKNALFERPVLVIKKFNDEMAWILPMSSTVRRGKYNYTIEFNKKLRSILLSQIRLVSAKRFRRFMGKISTYQLREIREKIKRLL